MKFRHTAIFTVDRWTTYRDRGVLREAGRYPPHRHRGVLRVRPARSGGVTTTTPPETTGNSPQPSTPTSGVFVPIREYFPWGLSGRGRAYTPVSPSAADTLSFPGSVCGLDGVELP